MKEKKKRRSERTQLPQAFYAHTRIRRLHRKISYGGEGGGGWNDQKMLSVAAIHLLESISEEGLKEEIDKGVRSVKNVTFAVP